MKQGSAAAPWNEIYLVVVKVSCPSHFFVSSDDGATCTSCLWSNRRYDMWRRRNMGLIAAGMLGAFSASESKPSLGFPWFQ